MASDAPVPPLHPVHAVARHCGDEVQIRRGKAADWSRSLQTVLRRDQSRVEPVLAVPGAG